jgi:pilus assembly protein CpaD
MSKEAPTVSLARLWFSAVALVVLAACASPTSHQAAADPRPVLPTEKYAIEVAKAPEVLRLSAHAEGLSSSQTAALRTFADRWEDSDHDVISIQSPANASNADDVYRTARAARSFLIAQGVDGSRIRAADYDAQDPKAPIILTFLRYQATGPSCGRAWSNIAIAHSDEPYPEFGCSVTANIAAMVANPEDLVHPRTTDPSDPNRRETVLGDYRQGADPSSAVNTQANGGFVSGF